MLRLVIGDILYFNLMGQNLIVLGSPGVIFEFLEKRATNTSDRKVYPLHELSVVTFLLTV